MLEFKVIENLKPNKDLSDILKDFKYKVRLGQIKTIIHTNLKVITPTEYQITYPTILTILEYQVNEISNKPFYIKKHNQKYNIKKIAHFLKKLIYQLHRIMFQNLKFYLFVLGQVHYLASIIV